MVSLAKEAYSPVPDVITPEDFRRETRKAENKGGNSFLSGGTSELFHSTLARVSLPGKPLIKAIWKVV
jgi:hypothetical protein